MKKYKICVILTMAILFTLVFGRNYTVSAGEPYVSARGAVLIEMETGQILYGKNEHDKLSIASTTKIMTTLLALEYRDIDTPFEGDENAIHVEGTSMGLLPGDIVTLRTLAYGMMLQSGNDAANAAAVEIAGSTDEFYELMNDRAAQIGMTNSSFASASGLEADGHYSTAYDMAILAATALYNPDFKEICSTDSIRVEYGNPPYERTLSNHNKMLDIYEGAIGVKTGYTKAAGRCLVSAAERDGVTLIAVTLGADDDWNAHSNMLDYGFSQVEKITAEDNISQNSISVVGSERASVGIKLAYQPTITNVVGSESEIEIITELPRFIYAPVQVGDEIGFAKFVINGKIVAQVPIITTGYCEIQHRQPGFWEKLWNDITAFFTGLF